MVLPYKSKHSCAGFTLLEVLVVLVMAGLLVTLLLPSLSFMRGLSHRTACSNNLRQLGIALFSYQQRHRHIPHASLVRILSNPSQEKRSIETTWMAILLADVDDRGIVNNYNFDWSFDDPANGTVVGERVGIYLCPAADDEPIDGFGRSNLVLAGLATAFVDQQQDHRIIVGEIVRNNLGWARPRATPVADAPNLPYSVFRPGITPINTATQGINVTPTSPDRMEDIYQFSSAHLAGANFLFADGHVMHIANSVDQGVLEAMLIPSKQN
jgi:prepilin-type N-terminal cleavage/methylation domain-containing protein/prepilin-type processing-associated H-X9-DG protein